MIRSSALLVAWACMVQPSLAQSPLTAIDWLERASMASAAQPKPGAEPPAANSVRTPPVTVTALDKPRVDAVGLLPPSTTGLPETLWQNSDVASLVDQMSKLEDEPLPAIQALYYTLLLAEAQSPVDAAPDARFLRARLDALRAFGAIEPAHALAERAGAGTAALFDRWLDLALLLGQASQPCQALVRDPSLTNSLSARIYCTARAGDWPTAALVLDGATSLDVLQEPDATLLQQFLNPEMIEQAAPPAIPAHVTILQFRLFEAVGAAIPTHNLPRPFAMADLRGNSGWKAEIEAAERLARTGAVPGPRLMGLYTERRPAASGGVWDRVEAVQALDNALDMSYTENFSAILQTAWDAARETQLEVVFADLFADRLLARPLPPMARALAFDIVLLSSRYEDASTLVSDPDPDQRFFIETAGGEPSPQAARGALQHQIATAFAQTDPPPEQAALLERGRLGEAILAAAAHITRASGHGRTDLGPALAALRAVGLEDTARRAALQLMLLERRQ